MSLITVTAFKIKGIILVLKPTLHLMQIILSVCKSHLLSIILQIANADRHFSTLIKTLKVTELVDKLNGSGPFSFLAPAKIALGHMVHAPFERLLKKENIDALPNLLAFHILPEKRLNKNFRNGLKLKTINGKELHVTVKLQKVHINGTRIMARDVQGTNGVVHSMDAVNIPS